MTPEYCEKNKCMYVTFINTNYWQVMQVMLYSIIFRYSHSSIASLQYYIIVYYYEVQIEILPA